MSAQDSYLDWEQEGHVILGNARKRFLQDGNEESFLKSSKTPTSAISTRKRKTLDSSINGANAKKRAAMREHTSTRMNQDVFSSSDMSMASSDGNVQFDENENDEDSSVGFIVKKPPPKAAAATLDFGRPLGGSNTFGRRRTITSSAPTQLDFKVRQSGQVLGLFEGIVRETRLYTAKDFKSRVLWEGRYEEIPHKGRYEQVSSYFDPMAQGRWIVSWDKDGDDNGTFSSRTADDLESHRFIMRHDGARGRALPKRLSSSTQPQQEKDDIFIKRFNPSGTRMRDIKTQVGLRKGDPFFVGSLSLLSLEGFETSGEMMQGLETLTRSVLSATPRSPTKSRRQDPPFWTIDNGSSSIAGVTLLCALSPDENPSSYQIRIAVDEKNDETIGVDVIFIGDKTVLSPASPIQLSKSALRLLAASGASPLGSKMNLDYSDDDDDDDNNNNNEMQEDFNDNVLGLRLANYDKFAIQSEDESSMKGVEKTTGDLKKSFEGHVESQEVTKSLGARVKSKAVTKSLGARRAGAKDCQIAASQGATDEQPLTKKVANRRVTATSIHPFGNHNSNVPKKTTGARSSTPKGNRKTQDPALGAATTQPVRQKVDFADDQPKIGDLRMKRGSAAMQPALRTVQKMDEPKEARYGDEESTTHPFVTPYVLATDKDGSVGGNEDDDDVDVDEIAPFPRVLDQRFETLSVEILNEPLLEATFRSEEQAREDHSYVSGLSHGQDDENQAGDSFGGDDYDYDDGAALLGVDTEVSPKNQVENQTTDHGVNAGLPISRDGLRMDHGDGDSSHGAPLLPNPSVDHHHEDEQAEEKNTTVLHKLDVALHDVFFGSHDEASLTVYGKDEEPVGAVVHDCRSYKTWLGYVWYQWMIPMSIMLIVTLPAAHYLFEYTRAMEMLPGPEPATWTEWFYSMF